MANKVSMEVRGLRELTAALRLLPPEVSRSKIIYRALHDGARVISAEARRLAPVLKDEQEKRRQLGAIRAGITQVASRREDNVVLVRVRNRGWIFGSGKGAESHRAGNPNYWWLVEFGTSKMAAQPFLRPAFESKKFPAARAIQLSLLKGLAVVMAKMGLKLAA